MLYSLRYVHLLAFLFVCCTACGVEDQSEQSAQQEITQTDNNAALSELNEAELSQQLPLEFEFSSSEKARYRSILLGIYEELTQESAQASGPSDPTASCDRCGRETGFLPSPDLFINQFLHVDMKAFTFGLIAWAIDLDVIDEVLSMVLGDEVPDSIELSHRLTVVRVDISKFNEVMETQASEGTLLEEQSPESVSITSVTTESDQFGLNLDHGYSYILFAHTVERVSKLSSLASSPILLRCFFGDESNQGGCLQLNSSNKL